MSACLNDEAVRSPESIAALRARLIGDAMMLRALAFRALRDGLPKAELRANNARAAARSLLRHARLSSEIRNIAVV